MNRKVYIPSIPTRYDAATDSRVPSVDLNPASEFGDLITMSNGIGSLKDQIADVALKAEQITPDDYILCVGDVILTATAISVANQLNTSITLLRWDKKRHCYDEVEVSL